MRRAALKATDEFLSSLGEVTSPRLRAGIQQSLETIATFPLSGSTDVPQSIHDVYGDAVRKTVVAPFDILYWHDAVHDTVCLLGLVRGRRVC